MMANSADLTEQVRMRLKQVPHKDQYGNERRFWGQLAAFIAGLALMQSNETRHVEMGRSLRNGSLKSFVDLLLERWA